MYANLDNQYHVLSTLTAYLEMVDKGALRNQNIYSLEISTKYKIQLGAGSKDKINKIF